MLPCNEILCVLLCRKMTSKTKQEICDILIAKGPDLLQKIELSELFYQYLGSEKVLQDTQLRDLKVSVSDVHDYCCYLLIY